MVDIFSQIKTKQQFEINALIFDRTTNDYRFEQSDFFRVYRCLWFEPNWFYSGARWNQLNTGRWINHLECHQCLPLNLQSLATLAVGCRHSTDRRLERSLRLHLVSPDAWDDELPHIQFDVLDSIRLWNLIQQTLTRPFPFHKNYEPTPACRIKCTAIDRDTPLHSNAMQMFQLQAHLNLADERANSLRKFVQQSATMFRLLAAADSSQVRSPTDIGRFHNLKENKALRIVEQHLNRKAEDESHQEDFRLSQTCDRNEQTLTYLTNSLHLHVIEIHKALTMCMFEASQESISSSVASKSIDSDATLKPPSLNKGLPNQKKAAKSKVAFTLNTSLIDQDRTYWKDESNQKKADTGQSDSIQLIVNSVKRFLVNLDRIVYIDRNNPLTVDEIVFGRLLPYMWRECNHRRRQARVQVNLNFVEQASRHSLGLAFETTCRMMMNISGILLVITLDYLFLMESSNQIYNDVQRLIMKIEDLARKAYVYADALVQRDRMISLFRSNHLKSNRREYELILDDKLPIESELHALVVLGYCIKMHYEYFVVCVTVSRSPSPAQAESTSQMIVTPNSKKWWPFKQRKPKRAKPRLDEINADNLISCEWSLNSRLTADTAFHRSMCTKSNLIDEIRRFNQELTNKQLMISLCQSSVRLQELMLFTSARSHQPPVCHLSRWAKLMNRLASDYETRPDESSLSTYQSVPIHSSETLNAPRLYQLFKRKWTHQRQVLLKQALELNQRERQLVLLDFEIKRRQPSINPFAWLNPRTRNLNRFKSQLEKKLGHLFEHRPLPPQCFTVNRILVERIDDTIHDSIGTKMPPSANNVDKYKFLPMWQQQLEKLIECNGLAAGSSILMQALPNESLFWENDSKVLGHMLQQFALQVLIKDTLASNKKWRDLNPMKTLPPKRHLIASLLQMFDRRPPKLSRDCLLSTQSLHLAIRLFWIELIDLSDRVIRSLFPVDWLDQYLLTIESELEETERGNLCYVQLQAIATQPIINFRPFAGWLSDCPLISRKTITRRIVTYEKSINQI